MDGFVHALIISSSLGFVKPIPQKSLTRVIETGFHSYPSPSYRAPAGISGNIKKFLESRSLENSGLSRKS
jgi:hypothetical protein